MTSKRMARGLKYMAINLYGVHKILRYPLYKDTRYDAPIDPIFPDNPIDTHLTPAALRIQYLLDKNHEEGRESYSNGKPGSYRYMPGGAEELVIAKDSDRSWEYACFVLKDRFELGEPSIATDAMNSAEYAEIALGKKRFVAGERVIATSAEASVQYAKTVIRGRFEPGEFAISKEGAYSCDYAKNVIRGRFIPGEISIIMDEYKSLYLQILYEYGIPTDGFRLLEDAVARYLVTVKKLCGLHADEVSNLIVAHKFF